MTKHLVHPIVLTALSAIATLLLPGADIRAAEWKLKNVSAITYNEISTAHGIDTIPTGLTEIRRPPPATVFLLLSYEIEVTWAKEDEELELPYEEIALFDGATKLEHLGYLGYLGQGDFGSPSSSYYAPFDLKPNPTVHLQKLMYIVPAKTKQFAFKVANQEAKVAVEKEPIAFDPTSTVDLSVEAVRLVEKVDMSLEQNNGAKVPTTLINEGGSIMLLTISVTPKIRNSAYANSFHWSPSWIHLTFGRGGRAVCAGGDDYDQIANSTQTIEATPDGKWPTKQITLYYPVPSNLRSFGVTFMGKQVATSVVR